MDRYPLRSFDAASPGEIEDAMERAEVVFFERSPVELPNEADLELMRTGLPRELQVKNISYHPESDSIPRFEAAPEIKHRIEQILRTHGRRVEAFLRRSCPDYVPGWTLGTTSFRSLEEQGRKLPPRSSNELVHIDAGAYGATNGARILRFFVNIHPTRHRVWGTKGGFAALMSRYPQLWDAAKGGKNRHVWHPHWVVLAKDKACGAGLKVVDIPEGAKPKVPETWPGVPLLIDSPEYPTSFKGDTVDVAIPLSLIGGIKGASFDGVTAGLKVDGNLHALLLCVGNVFKVASGDLSLPGKVVPAE